MSTKRDRQARTELGLVPEHVLFTSVGLHLEDERRAWRTVARLAAAAAAVLFALVVAVLTQDQVVPAINAVGACLGAGQG